MTQAICDITTDEVNVDVVVEPQADTMVEVANRAGGMEQVFHDNTLIGNGNSVDLGVNTEIIATKEYVDESKVDTYTKDEIDDKFTVANAQIDANADAIQKTREDYIQADSEIHQILNAHASELTTQRNDIDGLGDQVSAIESEIPDGTSSTNPLVNKQQLLDTEMNLRDDIDTADSELQTQINAQATAITNLDSEKLDKNQGTVNAGKVLTVGDDGIVVPSSGGTGGGLTAVAHDSSLAGAGTDESPLGIASTVLAEIAAKQDQLTAGDNITIVDNVISATGGGITDVVHDDTLIGNGADATPLGVNTEVIATKENLQDSENNTLTNVLAHLDETVWPEINSLKSDKQDKLVAGDGISISGNTISATGTGGTTVIIKRYS